MNKQEQQKLINKLERNINQFESWVKRPFQAENPCQVRHMLSIQNNAFNIAETALEMKAISYEEWEIYTERLLFVEEEPQTCNSQRCNARLDNGKCKYDFKPCELKG